MERGGGRRLQRRFLLRVGVNGGEKEEKRCGGKAWMPSRHLIEIFAMFGGWNQRGALVAQCSAQILCPTIRGVISNVSHSYEQIPTFCRGSCVCIGRASCRAYIRALRSSPSSSSLSLSPLPLSPLCRFVDDHTRRVFSPLNARSRVLFLFLPLFLFFSFSFRSLFRE